MASKTARLYQQRKAAGLCLCGSPPNPGRARCETCLAVQRRLLNARRAKRKADGHCHCGKPKEDPTKFDCATCQEARKFHPSRGKSGERIRKERLDAGLCPGCGGQPAPGLKRCQGCLDKRKTTYERLVREVYAAYGGATCSCCGEDHFLFLSIDHVHGGGNAHRRELAIEGGKIYGWLKKNGFPSGFQVLCLNCNMGRARNGGVCPHYQKE